MLKKENNQMTDFDHEVSVNCRLCNKTCNVKCNKDDYSSWKKGDGFIQDLLHYLSTDERELLISATCGECFDLLFPSNEEEEE
jgi:hypothetical protein